MKNKKGFTLVEMMVTIAIIAILSTIAVVNYISHRNNQQVIRASRSVYSALQSAKMLAIRDNASVCVLFTAGEGSSGGFQVFEDKNGNNALDAGEERSDGQMPPGVTLSDAGFSGDTQATFSSMGMPRQPGGALDFGSVEVSNSVRCSEIVVNSSGTIRIDECT